MENMQEKFIATVKEGVVSNFSHYKTITPILLAIVPKPSGEPELAAMALTPFMTDDGGKDIVALLLQTARANSPAVAMVTESWMVKKPAAKDASVKSIIGTVPPSEDPNRIEVVSIMLYFGTQTRMMWAEIIRPEKGDPFLGNWEDPGATQLQGRFAQAPANWN